MAVTSAIAQLRTTDLEASINFYVDKLGFELEFRYEDFYAGIRVGDSFFHLKLVDDKDPSIPFVAAGEHLHLFFPTDNVDELAETLTARGVALKTPVTETPWGTKQFYLEDNQGHVLAFSEGQD